MSAVSAGSFSDAQNTASQINTSFHSVVQFPYTRTLTMSQLEALGYDTANMSRPGTYSITIKSVSYNSVNGVLSLNMTAYHNGTELKVKNPWHFYMPFNNIGNTSLQRVNTFLNLLVSNLGILPYGSAENDDSTSIWPTDDARIEEGTNANYATIKADVGDTETNGATTANLPALTAYTTEDIYDKLGRGVFTFATSAIDDGATITAVTFRLLRSGRVTNLGWDGNIYAYGGTVGDPTNLAAGDYDGYSATAYSAATACPTSNGDLNFTGNAAFIAEVQDKIGVGEYTAVYLRDSFDVGTDTPAWSSGVSSYCTVAMVEHGTNSSRPFLYITYTLAGAPPVASYTHDCSNHCGAETCSFTDTSTNTPTSWSWKYRVNDGTWIEFSTAQNPAGIEFTTDGEYDVNLTATNDAGSDDELKNNIFNVWEMPIAAFTCNDLDACSNQYITCTDESTGGAGTSWRWRGKRTGVYSIFNTSQNAADLFAHGLWDIEFRVTTANACEDTFERLDYFSTDDPSTSQFTYNATTICEGGAVSYTDTSTGDEESWAWDCEYNSGTDFITENAICTYASAGTFDVEHDTDTSGCPSDQELKLNLVHVDGALTAEFSGDDLTICEGDHVHFTDESTGGTADTWSWDVDGDAIEEYSTQNPEHTYLVAGNYTVNLTVDNAGCAGDTESKVDYITVEECLWPVCDFSCTPLIGNSPLIVDCTDASTNTPTGWSWSRKAAVGGYTEFSTDQNPADISFLGGVWDVHLNVSNVYGYDVCEELDYIVSQQLPGIWVGVASLGEPEEESSRGFLLLGFMLLCGVIVVFTVGRR